MSIIVNHRRNGSMTDSQNGIPEALMPFSLPCWALPWYPNLEYIAIVFW